MWVMYVRICKLNYKSQESNFWVGQIMYIHHVPNLITHTQAVLDKDLGGK